MSSHQGVSGIGHDAVDRSSGSGAGKPRHFRGEDCLLGLLEHARRGGQPVSLGVPEAGTVTVDFERDCFLPAVRSEVDFFCASPASVRIEAASGFSSDESRPLNELMWKSAYYGSAGALLEGYHLYDVVELERWPNFTRLPHAKCCLPLCSLLARRPSSISFAHRMLRVPQADALRFYSAARAAGYLRLISSQPGRTEAGSEPVSGQSPEAGSEPSSFWTRLFSRFSGL